MIGSDFIKHLPPYLSEEDKALVKKAFIFARNRHYGQYRANEEPYILHPMAVAKILMDLEADGTTLAAALLHDVLEDTDATPKVIDETFGHEVLILVQGVTKLGKLSFTSKAERQAENFRKMFLAMAEDIRVILIKLADRLHNMRTLGHLPPEKQKEIATETMEIFAPLANRLGIGQIKWELEDLSLRYLEPEKYYEIARLVAHKRTLRQRVIDEAIEKIQKELARFEVKADISGRAKHFYSIYQKMQKQQKDFSEIYDILAVRILVDTLQECYEVLGVVHSLFKPIPQRFKDYIAMPKANMYQSLHTTVMSEGRPLEIQIRTQEMHQVAEHGIAAHWKYKEGIKSHKFEQKLSWIRQLIDWQKDLKDAGEFLSSLKIDLFTDEIFVFTPKGDLINLAKNSTPIDFAYRIHSDVGNHCVGAKLNGRMLPLNTPLNTGDIVEVVTNKAAHPSRDWLNFATTSLAKNRIRAWLKKTYREEHIVEGKGILTREFSRLGVSDTDDKEKELAAQFKHTVLDDFFEALGYGDINSLQIANKIKALYKKETISKEVPKTIIEEPSSSESKEDVVLGGMDNLLMTYAKCCNPIPREEIVGVVTRGRGIAIHRKGCVNVANIGKERTLSIGWGKVTARTYPVELEIEALDRVGLLKDVIAIISDMKTNIRAANVKTRKKSAIALLSIVVDVHDLEHLNRLKVGIAKISDVLRVSRHDDSKVLM